MHNTSLPAAPPIDGMWSPHRAEAWVNYINELTGVAFGTSNVHVSFRSSPENCDAVISAASRITLRRGGDWVEIYAHASFISRDHDQHATVELGAWPRKVTVAVFGNPEADYDIIAGALRLLRKYDATKEEQA